MLRVNGRVSSSGPVICLSHYADESFVVGWVPDATSAQAVDELHRTSPWARFQTFDLTSSQIRRFR